MAPRANKTPDGPSLDPQVGGPNPSKIGLKAIQNLIMFSIGCWIGFYPILVPTPSWLPKPCQNWGKLEPSCLLTWLHLWMHKSQKPQFHLNYFHFSRVRGSPSLNSKTIDDKMDVGLDFGGLLGRFLVDFGSKLGAKLRSSWHQNRKNEGPKTMSKNHQKNGDAGSRK